MVSLCSSTQPLKYKCLRHILMMIMHEPIGVPLFTSSGSYEFEKTEKYIVINLLWVPFNSMPSFSSYVCPHWRLYWCFRLPFSLGA